MELYAQVQKAQGSKSEDVEDEGWGTMSEEEVSSDEDITMKE